MELKRDGLCVCLHFVPPFCVFDFIKGQPELIAVCGIHAQDAFSLKDFKLINNFDNYLIFCRYSCNYVVKMLPFFF